MILNMSGGGGGASLNFNVVGGTSAPSNPKENTIWVNTSTAITSWDFSATEPAKRSANKNLILYPYYNTTKTTNGITFTSNADGTITANGTATAEAVFDIIYCWNNTQTYPLDVGKAYVLSGCPSGGGSGYNLQAVFRSASNASSYGSDNGSGLTFTADTTKYRIGVRIVIASGTKVSSIVFKPQLEKGSTATSFVKGDATGQVWFPVDTSNTVEFNALKKNCITVYPLSAKQYVNGAWVGKIAKIYKNGALVDLWNGVLLDPNDTSNHYTGGWVGDSSIPIYTTTERTNKAPTATYGSNNVTLSMSGKSEGSYRTEKKVDVSGFNTLTVDVSSANAQNGFIVVFVSNKLNANAWDNSAAITPIIDKTTSGAKTVTLDISSVSGEYYIGVALAAYGNDAITTNITKISLK